MEILVVVGSMLVVVGIAVAITLAVRTERRDRRTPIPAEALAAVDGLRPRIVELLRRGRAIEAVKLVRQATGLSLQSSKDLVDAIAAEERVDPRRRSRR